MSAAGVSRTVGGICRRCTSALETRRDGFVWCSNAACWHHRHEPHPTGPTLNLPDTPEA